MSFCSRIAASFAALASIVCLALTAPAVGANATPNSTNPGGGGGTGNETWARISCVSARPASEAQSKSWGVDYPRSTWIKVVEELRIDGKMWKRRTNQIMSSASGSWSRPTQYDPTFLGGTYEIVTHVYRVSNGALLGSDSGKCKL